MTITPLGVGGRARRVLEEGQRRRGPTPGSRQSSAERRRPASVATAAARPARGRRPPSGRRRPARPAVVRTARRPGVVDDRPEPGHRPVRPRQVGGDGDDAGVQAAEEGGDELQARRVEQQRPLAGQPERLEPRGDGPGPAVEVRRRSGRASGLVAVAVREKAKARSSARSSPARSPRIVDEGRGRRRVRSSVRSTHGLRPTLPSLLRRLSGLMSVQTSSMNARHSSFVPALPASDQPGGDPPGRRTRSSTAPRGSPRPGRRADRPELLLCSYFNSPLPGRFVPAWGRGCRARARRGGARGDPGVAGGPVRA